LGWLFVGYLRLHACGSLGYGCYRTLYVYLRKARSHTRWFGSFAVGLPTRYPLLRSRGCARLRTLPHLPQFARSHAADTRFWTPHLHALRTFTTHTFGLRTHAPLTTGLGYGENRMCRTPLCLPSFAHYLRTRLTFHYRRKPVFCSSCAVNDMRVHHGSARFALSLHYTLTVLLWRLFSSTFSCGLLILWILHAACLWMDAVGSRERKKAHAILPVVILPPGSTVGLLPLFSWLVSCYRTRFVTFTARVLLTAYLCTG